MGVRGYWTTFCQECEAVRDHRQTDMGWVCVECDTLRGQ